MIHFTDSTVINIIIMGLILIGILVIYFVLGALTSFLNAHANYMEKKEENVIFDSALTRANTLKVESETLSILLLAIDNLISVEIANIIKTYLSLGEQYPLIKMDDDIKVVAQQVFDGLRKEYLFSNDHTIITDDYIMRYIQNQTIIMFIRTIQEMNRTIKGTL